VRHHAEGLLKLCSHAVHEARANDGMALQLDRQGFEEGVALQGWMGTAAAWTALYSSSLRLSGMGVLERGQAPYHKPNRGMTGEGRRHSARIRAGRLWPLGSQSRPQGTDRTSTSLRDA
jgi:hypothetical protein